MARPLFYFTWNGTEKEVPKVTNRLFWYVIISRVTVWTLIRRILRITLIKKQKTISCLPCRLCRCAFKSSQSCESRKSRFSLEKSWPIRLPRGWTKWTEWTECTWWTVWTRADTGDSWITPTEGCPWNTVDKLPLWKREWSFRKCELSFREPERSFRKREWCLRKPGKPLFKSAANPVHPSSHVG